MALVEQQGDFIAKETTLRVSKCYGATAIDLADRRSWKKEIEEHDVLVMTGVCFVLVYGAVLLGSEVILWSKERSILSDDTESGL